MRQLFLKDNKLTAAVAAPNDIKNAEEEAVVKARSENEPMTTLTSLSEMSVETSRYPLQFIKDEVTGNTPVMYAVMDNKIQMIDKEYMGLLWIV